MPQDQFAEIISRVDTEYSEYQWNGIKIMIRPIITLGETINLVNSVMDSCVDHSRGMFLPEMLDFTFRANVILAYTNIRLPHDINSQYILLYGTDLYADLLEVVNNSQIEAMEKCIERFTAGMSQCVLGSLKGGENHGD